jgi:hypothetical protein
MAQGYLIKLLFSYLYNVWLSYIITYVNIKNYEKYDLPVRHVSTLINRLQVTVTVIKFLVSYSNYATLLEMCVYRIMLPIRWVFS